MEPNNPKVTCTATNRQGKRCARYPIPGGNVCMMHGGKAPQTMAAAKLRLAALVDPAIGVLARAMKDQKKQPASALAAARDVLDRAGFKAKDSLELTGGDGGPLIVRYIDAPVVSVLVNGKVNGHGD